PPAGELAEDPHGLAGIGDGVFQAHRVRIGAELDDGVEHYHRAGAVVADGGRERPAGHTGAGAHRRDAERLTRDLDRVFPNDQRASSTGVWSASSASRTAVTGRVRRALASRRGRKSSYI